MAFRSFEISFQPKEASQHVLEDGSDVYAHTSRALGEAFAWLYNERGAGDVDIALLEVLRELTPPMHGQITETEVKGKLVGFPSLRLSREHTKQVRKAIAERDESRDVVLLVGKIRELDRDRLTFILRELADGSRDTACAFEEDIFDAVWDALDSEHRVNVVGSFRPKSNILEVLGVEPAPEEGAPRDIA
jgi:hypothetical protein